MRVNPKARRAVDAMIDLALHEPWGPVVLAAIARRQRVSLSYLEQLFARLLSAGLVKSIRGPGGGYRLGSEPARISVAAIVHAVETELPTDTRLDARSVVTELTQQLDALLQGYLAGVALSELLVGQKAPTVHVVVRPPRDAPAPPPRKTRVPAGVPNSVFELGKVMAVAGALPSGRRA